MVDDKRLEATRIGVRALRALLEERRDLLELSSDARSERLLLM
jgi:hypothetical protein